MRRKAFEELYTLLGSGVRRFTSSAFLLESQTQIPGINSAGRISGLAPPREPREKPAWVPDVKADRITTPLTKPLKGLKVPPPYRASKEPPPTEITTLENGARIISEASPVSAC